MSNAERILPQNISIAGFVYSITYVSEWRGEDRVGLKPGDEPWGRTRHRDCVIEIWDQLSPQQQLATLLHEVIHCCENIADINIKERHLSRIANILHGVLLDNQLLTKLYTR
jgi:hypothetical protein